MTLQSTENEIESSSLSLRRSGVGVLGGFLGLVRGTSATASVVLCSSYDVLLTKWKFCITFLFLAHTNKCNVFLPLDWSAS